jgi:hypothetical protein
MRSNAILLEAQKLHDVSNCLDALAEEHAVVSEALVKIVVMKLGQLTGGPPAMA